MRQWYSHLLFFGVIESYFSVVSEFFHFFLDAFGSVLILVEADDCNECFLPSREFYPKLRMSKVVALRGILFFPVKVVRLHKE